MVKAWKDSAWAEFEDWISRDRKAVSRILRLLKGKTGTVERRLERLLELPD